MAIDHNNFAFSFSHAIIKLNETQYTGISNVEFSQDIDRSAIYGTDRRPLKRSAGQLGMGEGNITFSDLEEGMKFYKALGANPSAVIFSCDVTLSNDNGDTRSFELVSCALSGISGSFESGADALGMEFPMTFMAIKVDAADFAV